MPSNASPSPKAQAGARRDRDVDDTLGSCGAASQAVARPTAQRQLRHIALHILTRWMPDAAPLRPQVPQFCFEHPFNEDAAARECTMIQETNMAACTRLVTAAGRRGAQRLAAAVITAENVTTTHLECSTEHKYAALMQLLFLFAATTSPPAAPLAVVRLRLGSGHCVGAQSVLGSMIKASLAGATSSQSTILAAAQSQSCDAMLGAITAALRPRELEIDVIDSDDGDDANTDKAVSCSDLVPWIREQRQLRTLRVAVNDTDEASAVIEAVAAAGAVLEELDLGRLPEDASFSELRPMLFHPGMTAKFPGRIRAFRFPGLRILRIPDAEIEGNDLRELAEAARALEVLAIGKERKSVTADDWNSVLRQMTCLHTLVITEPSHRRKRVPRFYQALRASDCAPVCTLRVLECLFAPMPDVMHSVFNAVALKLPNLESFGLPVEIFNALALVETEDEMAKNELRAAIQAAASRCKSIPIQVSFTVLPEIHINALQELLRLLPGLQRFGPVDVFRESSMIQDIAKLPQVLSRSTKAAQGRPTVVCPLSQIRELDLYGALSYTDLVAIASTCPQLRVLRCEYGGARPLVKMDRTSQLEFVPFVAESIFLDWLGGIVDISPAKSRSSSASTAAAAGGAATTAQPQAVLLRHLRRLLVRNPPFDGERDAATMDALERVRAHSSVLIDFD